MEIDLERVHEVAQRLVREAGDTALEKFHSREFHSAKKGHDDVVTSTDLACILPPSA